MRADTSTATRVIFEPGGLARLGDDPALAGAGRVLVVTTPARRHLAELAAALPGRRLEVFDGARVHVPETVVTAASAALEAFAPDLVIALGGGAATGLGKVLRQRHGVRLVIVPTTFAGSEATSIVGTTVAGDKRTGRDDAARPELVLYDAALLGTLSVGVAVQSLLNALAHPVSALSTGALGDDLAAEALDAARAGVSTLRALVRSPPSVALLAEGQRAAHAAARVLDRAPMGLHHRVAHWLGGRFDLPHAALHSVLLPATLARLRAERPALAARLDEATGGADLAAEVTDLLAAAALPGSLAALGVGEAALREALSATPTMPAELLVAVLHDRPRPGRLEA